MWANLCAQWTEYFKLIFLRTEQKKTHVFVPICTRLRRHLDFYWIYVFEMSVWDDKSEQKVLQTVARMAKSWARKSISFVSLRNVEGGEGKHWACDFHHFPLNEHKDCRFFCSISFFCSLSKILLRNDWNYPWKKNRANFSNMLTKKKLLFSWKYFYSLWQLFPMKLLVFQSIMGFGFFFALCSFSFSMRIVPLN